MLPSVAPCVPPFADNRPTTGAIHPKFAGTSSSPSLACPLPVPTPLRSVDWGLNARGTPLEQSDLIKNFVLSREGGAEASGWGNLDDTWWRAEVRQGRLFRPRLDMLLNYWLAMRTSSEVSPSKVFDVFRSYVCNHGVNSVMAEIMRDMMNYCEFETAQGRDPEEKLFYYRVGVMQVGVITPVLLQLLSAESGPRQRAFDALESFLVRRLVCLQTTKDYNRLTLELASRLRESGLDDADKVTIGFLKEQTANASRVLKNGAG